MMAVEKGLDGLAITDHDTIESFSLAEPTAKEVHLQLLPGIEISAELHGEPVHILGYAFRPQDSEFRKFCDTHRKRREVRNALIVEKLTKAGMTLTMDEVKSLSPNALAYGRVHIALAMEKRGYVPNIRTAFQWYIGQGKSCYVSGEKWTVEESIQAVQKAGGKAVLAHPHLIAPKWIAEALISMPFDGIEAYYGGATSEENNRWCQIALKKGWFATGGSDFHGASRMHAELGSAWTPEETFSMLYSHFLKTVEEV
jgi:predicted metal-dependent phosphoesterase TrpH